MQAEQRQRIDTLINNAETNLRNALRNYVECMTVQPHEMTPEFQQLQRDVVFTLDKARDGYRDAVRLMSY